MISIQDWIKKIRGVSSEEEPFQIISDVEGVNFVIDPIRLKALQSHEIHSQYVLLQMLVEQGCAERIPNGFIIPTKEAVLLDEAFRELLGLPPVWNGCLRADVKGHTPTSAFSVTLSVETITGTFTRGYQIEGPILRLSEKQKYLLTPAQERIFSAIQTHQESEHKEYDNLKMLMELQQGKSAGAKIDLAHFEKLNVKEPETVSIQAEWNENGDLILTPFMGQDASPEQVSRVLGQLKSKNATALRVNDEIILFDEKRLEAVHEIIRNRRVPKDRVKAFLEEPTAFIDASLVDLDLGFSHRVKGATAFRHAYLGETDGSGIDWFGTRASTSSVMPIHKLQNQVSDYETFEQAKQKIEDAKRAGAQEVEFDGERYDISSHEEVDRCINRIQEHLELRTSDTSVALKEIHSRPEEEESEEESIEVAVVDIELNDEDLGISSPIVDKAIQDVSCPESMLDWSNYAREPLSHQRTGIRWIVGLAELSEGGLLADDMGLGKTYMALAGIDQLYKIAKRTGDKKKPTLIVAPLSLLENWKDEVAKTFSRSPFTSIIVLQSGADLNTYRLGGVETRNQELAESGDAEIRYSLKIGKEFGIDRLDQYERLVITTYQTMRDYQFSLCRVDWGVVVFDEAQNIKNPNALQTRAAKGLKANFKLLATGTPVENSLADFWCLMDTCCPGYLKTYQEFNSTYIKPILNAAGDEVEDVRARVGRALRIAVGALMLRRVKEDHLDDLPKKTIHVGIKEDTWVYEPILDTTMAGVQKERYDAILNAQAEDEEGHQHLGNMQRLRDVSLHPRLINGGRLNVVDGKINLRLLFCESYKMKSLVEILDRIQTKREKCIIFIVNKRLQLFLSVALARWYCLMPLSIVNGDAKAVAKRKSVPTRKSMIADFEATDGFNIIIMSPVAAGVGLTVVGANHVIHFERHWNPAKEAQATDRVYRIGAKKDVHIYVPILHHPKFESFDANLHRLLSKKTSLRDAVVTPEQVLPSPGGSGGMVLSKFQQLQSADLTRISWTEFEALCAILLSKEMKAQQYWLTNAGADYGADVVLAKSDTITLVQCKHTLKTSYDGYRAIQEVQSAKIKYENALHKGCSRLIFMTNAAKISARARKLAVEYGVEIVPLSDLASLLDNFPAYYPEITTTLAKQRLVVY